MSNNTSIIPFVCVCVCVCMVHVQLWVCSWRLIPGLHLLSILVVETRTFARVPQLCGTGWPWAPEITWLSFPALGLQVRAAMSESYVDARSEFIFGVFFTLWLRLSGCTHVLYFGLALEAVPYSEDLDSFDRHSIYASRFGQLVLFLGCNAFRHCGKQWAWKIYIAMWTINAYSVHTYSKVTAYYPFNTTVQTWHTRIIFRLLCRLVSILSNNRKYGLYYHQCIFLCN